MSVEHRRSERIIDYLPIAVDVIGGGDGQLLAGPFAGSIIDVSRHGACLLMTQVFRNRFHLFHSTREISEAVLKVRINHPPDLSNYILTAHPVWLDLFQQQEIRAFKMGIEFTENPEAGQMKALQQALQKNQEERGNWWRKHCKFWGKNKQSA